VRFGGQEHLLISEQDFFADADDTPARIWLRSRGTPEFAFSITPPLPAAPKASLPLTETAADADVVRFAAAAAPRNLDLKCIQLQTAGKVPPVKAGPVPAWRPRGVALAPDDARFAQAAKWSLTLPPGVMDDLSELFLEVKYQGDVARLGDAHRLLADDFFNGHPWFVGLGRFLDPRGANTFELSILPLREDAPVYFELPKQMVFPANGQVDQLDGVRLLPGYQLILWTAGAK
jgi:beta-galactosidase